MTNKDHPLSWQALGRVVAVGLGLYLAYRGVDVIIGIILGLIIATALFPFVKKLNKKMSLLWSSVIVFGLVLVPFVLFGVFAVPRIIAEIPSLLTALNRIVSNAAFLPEQFRAFDAVAYFASHSGDFVSSASSVAVGVLSVVTVFFLAFYFVLDNKRFLGFFLDLFPPAQHDKIGETLDEIARLNGQYIRGNVAISGICAAFLYVVLLILGIPFALPLAIFAGVMDLLPLVGSTLGAIPAIVIGFTVSPLAGFLILILHLVYQQIENVVISPAIYKKTLDISPALSFLAVVIGGGLFGILGAFLALPVAASLPAVMRHYHHHRQGSYQHPKL